MFSVRIVDLDFYVAKPTERLDVLYSEFRETNVTRAPVLRVFGSTPCGQKTCLHVHQVFPYIFVPYDGTQPTEKYLKQFATSVDFAVQVALGKATSATKHVYKTEIVRRVPFYGYHENEEEFIKIEFYNPRIVAKVVDLLQNGAILNKIFQPYESHIPYILQFLIDFNLYGMNLLHARKVCFRGWSGMGTKDSQSHESSLSGSSCTPNDSSSFHASTTSRQYWNEKTIPSDLCLGQDVIKTSCCELEVDVIAEDILNQLEIGTSIGHNPGIAAMWEDEKQRRRDRGQPSQISIPVSQDRGEMKLLNSEREFKERIHEIIQERNQMIQSQLEVMEKSLSPEDFQELSQSILLSGKQPCSQTIISQDVDESIPVVNESVIEDILHTSQSQPDDLSGQIDDELVAILLSLAGDPNDHEPQECSPKANTSQVIVPEDKESDNEDEESIIMSQPIWNEDELTEDGGSGSQSADDEEDWKPQRIPQFDGPVDDDASLVGSKSTSRSSQGSKKDKTGMNIEVKSDSDGDDFRLKKKPKISGKNEIIPGLDKNISKKKREPVTRKRKTARAQLDVLGGNTKQRNIRNKSTIHSETATKTKKYCPIIQSEKANCSNKTFPNLELFHQSSRPLKSDLGLSLGFGVGRKKRCRSQLGSQSDARDVSYLAEGKVKDKRSNSENTNLKISKKMKDNMFHEETESSGSQTSDFELHLSDSSIDSEDFKSAPTIAEDFHKRESFYVAKQAPDKSRLSKKDDLERKKAKRRNTELLDKDVKLFPPKSTTVSKDRQPSSGNQTKISTKLHPNSQKMLESISTEHENEVKKTSAQSQIESGLKSKRNSEKDTETLGSTLESRKRKRTRSKKATCLMFTHVGDRSQAEKPGISERNSCRKSEIHYLTTEVKECPSNLKSCTELKKERSGNTILRDSRDSKEVRNERKICRNAEIVGKVKKASRASVSRNSGTREVNFDGKLPGNRILLDACIRLEKISVKELKYKNNTANEPSSRNSKNVVLPVFHSSKDYRGDGLDSLYQMAIMSPRSVRDNTESPPFPSSPSVNFISQDQSLKISFNKFSDKQNTLDDDDAGIDVGLSLKRTTADFPIKFVGEEEVVSINNHSGSASEGCIEEQLNITAYADDVLSQEVSTVCNSLGDEEGTGVGICRDVETLSPEMSAICDSFSIGEEQSGMNIQDVLQDIESSDVLNNQETNSETNSDSLKVIKEVEGHSVSEDQILSNETYSKDHHNSEKDNQIKIIPCMNEKEYVHTVDPKFLEKQDALDIDIVTDRCSSIEQATILAYHDSEKNDDIKTTRTLHQVDYQAAGTSKTDLMSTSMSRHDSEKGDHSKIWRPATEPPSRSYVLETRRLYGLPHERHVKAFCSNPKDAPSAARVIGGRRLQVSSLSVDDLAEFDLGGHFQTLNEFRCHARDNMDNSLFRDCLRSLDAQSDNYGSIGIPSELKIALMGDHQVILTPVKLPPSPTDVRKWMKERRTVKRRVSQSQVPKVVEKENDNSPDLARNEIPDQVEVSNTLKDKNLGKSLNDNSIHTEVSKKLNDLLDSVKIADPTIDSGETSQPTKSVSENASSIGPHHSTPVGNPGMKCRKLWQCTPVEGGDDLGCEIRSEDKPCMIKSLRRNILNSQKKDFDSHPQLSPSEASYIEGPTPTNSFGFKISQPNIQDAKSVRQVQFLTLLSLELHVRTRKSLRPDPEFDAICGIFYHIEHETRQGKEYETGIIVVRSESTKLRSSDTDASTSSLATGQPSASMQTPHHSTSGQTPFEDCLLHSAGISNELNIITEQQETDAINRLIKLVRDWDPDILLGFEVQMLSWGYLIQRASTLGIDLAPQLSRIQDSSATARCDAEKDQWGASYTSEISITGRIVLNVWRLMKHEVTLNVYSFENISYHVLHERIPLYTFRQLTLWWDQKLPHDRWRTVEHYVIRCQGNVRILNHVDFINRTSEFARLYGILFYSVVSRGSQFRVESMMLRLAKPMNYLAVSPSIQQRARMDAPECIPLVMEPESRFYTDPVIVLDFQSLYPSMMIAYNYCFSTCLGKVSRLDKIGNFDFGCTSLNIPPALLEKLENDIHVSANGSAFVKSDIRRGILPRMVEEILDTRVMVKKAMKEQKSDKVLGQLLDARQLGLKLIANVTYGYTSANFSGRMPCVEIADAIVRKARETLERAIHLVNSREEWSARVVYGDTDSLFVLVKGATKEEAFKIGQEIVGAVTADNPKPVKLKFEKVYLPCVLETKKRYVGYMYETLDQKEPVFDAKGIETVRRDTCPAVAKILEKSLRILFEEKDVSLVKKYVQRQFRKLMEEQVSIQDFIFAKEYRGMKRYKPTACVPALELARRHLARDRRAEPRVGERVPYVVVNGSPGLPLIQLVRNPGDVLEDSSLRLNSSYYINKQILPPLNRVFSLIGIDVFTWYTELPRYFSRHHVVSAKQKSSISRFFTTLHCPVCEQLTQQGLCRGCRDNPQKAVVMLAERVANWERKYSHLTEICFQCCGTRDLNMACVSLDCPVMFKRIKMKRKLEYGETLRDVQKGIEVMNN